MYRAGTPGNRRPTWPYVEDLMLIYVVLTPSAVLFWHTTAILLGELFGDSGAAKLAAGFVGSLGIVRHHNWFICVFTVCMFMVIFISPQSGSRKSYIQQKYNTINS